MATFDFQYNLMYKPGNLETRPIGETEDPVNLIALAEPGGPTQAVIWDRPTQTWTFRPDAAVAILYANPERHRIRVVDRQTAEREAPRFATTPLPSEAELTEICRAAQT